MLFGELSRLAQVKKKIDKKQPTLVYIGWRNCGPCAMATKILEELQAAKRPLFKDEQLFIFEIDDTDVVDDQFLTTHKVAVIPNLLVFRKGKEIARVQGVEGNSELSLKEAYMSAINKAKRKKSA